MLDLLGRDRLARRDASDEIGAVLVVETTRYEESRVFSTVSTLQRLLHARQAIVAGGLLVEADALPAIVSAAVARALTDDIPIKTHSFGMLNLTSGGAFGAAFWLGLLHRRVARGKPRQQERYGREESEVGLEEMHRAPHGFTAGSSGAGSD